MAHNLGPRRNLGREMEKHNTAIKTMLDILSRKHHEGYQQSRAEYYQRLLTMSEKEILEDLDQWFGRENLGEEYTIDELRAEARRQHELDWRIKE